MSAKVITSKASITSHLRDRLRGAILSGEIPPRSKLRLEQLSSNYGVSMSPVREALLHLMGESLVVSEDQRGFAVADTSMANLREVTALRCLVEPFALRLAIQHGDVQWEERLVGLLHRLTRIESSEELSRRDDWERAHREFHLAMLDACQMPMLLAFCGTLYDHSYRYRPLYLVKNPPTRNPQREHSAILDAVLARNADRACELLLEHVERTSGIIIAAMEQKLAVEKAEK